MLSVIMLSVIMLSVIMLSVIIMSVIMLNVVAPVLPLLNRQILIRSISPSHCPNEACRVEP